jgi:uncharacterized RmlC-like cupin family protein
MITEDCAEDMHTDMVARERRHPPEGGTATRIDGAQGEAGSAPDPAGFLGIAKPDAQVEIVPANAARRERYQVILPRQDRIGWRMARVEGPEGRLELIAPDLCSTRGIHLSIVTVPVGYRDRSHFHVSGEKVMYVVRGFGVIMAGEDLEFSHEVGPGDAVYVPPFAVHAPMNAGESPFEFVMASNAPLDVTVPGGTMPEEGEEVLA